MMDCSRDEPIWTKTLVLPVLWLGFVRAVSVYTAFHVFYVRSLLLYKYEWRRLVQHVFVLAAGPISCMYHPVLCAAA